MEVFIGFFAVVFLGFVAFFIWYRRAEKRWSVIDQGFYLGVEYGYDTYVRSAAGMANHSKTEVRFDVTVIRFSDGHTRVLRGRYSIPFSSGTKIRIVRNGVGDVCLEDARESG